ncbi:MAG TPA: hypothetical protein VHY59_13340, partial [Chthoniobacterales bacterium]|nr:hypothetical protein [Chthoniobacterales bacterium]
MDLLKVMRRRSIISWDHEARSDEFAPVLALMTHLGLLVLLTLPARTFAQTSVQPGQFGVKLSGFENLVGGSASTGTAGTGGSSESEIDVTPQYKTSSGTVFAARGVLNLLADSNVSGSSSAWSLSVPELSFFVIGAFGRIEIGDRAGFPQSLIGFTPSEIAFTSAEFGPDSGVRLDPNGRLPTTFLPHALADRINNLTYLGYAERFYDDRSLKLIYLTPRSVSGFYGAVSYTPSTDISSGFDLAGATHTPTSGLEDTVSPGVFRNIVQAAVVWNHRTDVVDLSAGLTYSYARGSAGSLHTPTDPESHSLSGGIAVTVYDAWTFGLSGTYDGFSTQHTHSSANPSPTSPYGVVASVNYVNGAWTFGGYYQHATADSLTPQSSRDTVDIAELGLSYLVDKNHNLLGMAYYTDVKLFASVYYYRFRGAQGS